MTAAELIARLEDYDPDTEVMIAHQPNWPLAETLASVVDEAELEDLLEDDASPTATIWLVAGGKHWDRSPYAPAAVFDEAGR